VAKTNRADQIERAENTIARLNSMIGDIEVLAALYQAPKYRRRLIAILQQIEAFHTDVLDERNGATDEQCRQATRTRH
jgi:hypothetical protein